MPTPSSSARDRRKGTPKDTAAAKRLVKIEKIRKHASICLEQAYREGASLADVEDIEDVLQKYADDYGFPDGHFSDLSMTDRCNLLLKFLDSKRQATGQAAGPVTNVADPKSASPHTSIVFGQTTPTQSPRESECDEESEGRGEEESHDDSIGGGKLTIVTVDGDPDFDITFFHPDRAKYELLTAARCKNERSYISVLVAKRYNIGPTGAKDRSIRLTWKHQTPTKEAKERRKTRSTRFWYIEDDKIDTDIVLGTGFDKSDEPDKESEHGSDEEVGSLSDDASDDQEDGKSDSSARESSDETDDSTEDETDTDGGDITADDDQDSDDGFVQVDNTNTISLQSQIANNTSNMRRAGKSSMEKATQLITGIVVGAAEYYGADPRQVVKPVVVKKPTSKKPTGNQMSLAKPAGRSRPKKAASAVEPEPPIVRRKKRHTSKDANLPTKRREGQKASRSTKTQDLPKPARKSKGNG